MNNNKESNFVECGPGNVLMGINRRILKDISTMTTDTLENIKKICIKN